MPKEKKLLKDYNEHDEHEFIRMAQASASKGREADSLKSSAPRLNTERPRDCAAFLSAIIAGRLKCWIVLAKGYQPQPPPPHPQPPPQQTFSTEPPEATACSVCTAEGDKGAACAAETAKSAPIAMNAAITYFINASSFPRPSLKYKKDAKRR
jgi:hypothetical protein